MFFSQSTQGNSVNFISIKDTQYYKLTLEKLDELKKLISKHNQLKEFRQSSQQKVWAPDEVSRDISTLSSKLSSLSTTELSYESLDSKLEPIANKIKNYLDVVYGLEYGEKADFGSSPNRLRSAKSFTDARTVTSEKLKDYEINKQKDNRIKELEQQLEVLQRNNNPQTESKSPFNGM